MRVVRLLFLILIVSSLAACGTFGGKGKGGGGGRDRSGDVSMSGGTKTRPDAASEKFIYVQNQRGDAFKGVFENNGAYDPAAMERIRYVFRDTAVNEIGAIDPELIDYLVDIRTRLGMAPDTRFEIMSGYRNPKRNAAMHRQNGNVALESFHPKGLAVDFRIYGPNGVVNGQAIAAIAKTMQRGGVSYYPKTNHVHVDMGWLRTWKAK
jgi:uncharacterized protein YcbK (DUF882 family)